MLEIQGLGVEVGTGETEKWLLKGVTLRADRSHFGAIIGPSGCGKSTLLKAIAGIVPSAEGTLLWSGHNLEQEADMPLGDIGYVPQFNITYDSLTVGENLEATCALRLGDVGRQGCLRKAGSLAKEVGLDRYWDQRVSSLSGGQKRRLALALELASSPSLLLCDEVTSGLDMEAETTIVHYLHRIAKTRRCLVLSVTHSLRHLEQYDTVTVLYEGHLAFHGPPALLLRYFRVEGIEGILPMLPARSPQDWSARASEERWQAHAAPSARPSESSDPSDQPTQPAGHGSQWWTMLVRRLTLFIRDPAQVALQVALLLLFPAIVVLFAYQGLPQIRNLSMELGTDVIQQLKEAVDFSAQTARVGSLVSGLILFQVILLTLMGANNAAREIVSCRPVIEKEKLAGLSVIACLGASVVLLVALVVVQSVWMGFFVKWVCDFPGPWFPQMALLVMVNAALTSTSLAISAWAGSAERASLLSIYMVGFQLPLSGAVLALPEWIAALFRPFIASYWAWSGYLHSMRDTRFYDVVISLTDTPIATYPVCIWVLGCHVLAGLIFAALGTWRSQWAAH